MHKVKRKERKTRLKRSWSSGGKENATNRKRREKKKKEGTRKKKKKRKGEKRRNGKGKETIKIFEKNTRFKSCLAFQFSQFAIVLSVCKCSETWTQKHRNSKKVLHIYNGPFYSCVLRCLAFEWKWGWHWPCLDRNLLAFLRKFLLISMRTASLKDPSQP